MWAYKGFSKTSRHERCCVMIRSTKMQISYSSWPGEFMWLKSWRIFFFFFFFFERLDKQQFNPEHHPPFWRSQMVCVEAHIIKCRFTPKTHYFITWSLGSVCVVATVQLIANLLLNLSFLSFVSSKKTKTKLFLRIKRTICVY